MNPIQGKILIIDDDKDFWMLLRDMLEDLELDLEIIEAESIESGWNKIFEANPDLVFLDLEFKGDFTQSNRMLREISNPPYEIPVILVSNHATMPPELAKAHWNVHHFIAKPPKEEELKFVVPSALKIRQEQKKNAMLIQKSIQSRDDLQYEYADIIGESPALLRVLGMVD